MTNRDHRLAGHYAVLTGIFLSLMAFSCPAQAGAGSGVKLPRDPAAAMGIVPHKALYNVRLASAKNGSQIINIQGRMYFEWKPSCDGWITNHRFNLVYEYADSPGMTLNSDFSTFESYDGGMLNFSSRRKRDGELYEELRGNAARDPEKGGQAVYAIPAGLTYEISPDMLFPMTHTMALVNAARSGKKILNAGVFDGSDAEGPVEISAFLGPRQTGAPAVDSPAGYKPVKGDAMDGPSTIDRSLIDNAAWNIRMAFFPTKSAEEDADYEMTMRFHDNGIISSMSIDYGDFIVDQTLVALEKINDDGCGAGAKKTVPSKLIP